MFSGMKPKNSPYARPGSLEYALEIIISIAHIYHVFEFCPVIREFLNESTVFTRSSSLTIASRLMTVLPLESGGQVSDRVSIVVEVQPHSLKKTPSMSPTY